MSHEHLGRERNEFGRAQGRGLARRASAAGKVAAIAAVAGAGALVLVAGSASRSPAGEHVVNAAATGQPAGAGPSVGGWGRGGYPMVRRTGGPGRGGAPMAPSNAAAMQSVNWAGYADAGTPGQFTSVSTSWTQPAVTCGATNTFSSFWAGLDGDGTATVEQTGTEADCSNGAATYQGWYEMFPKAPVFYPNPVKPGDAMSASVVSGGNGMFTLTLSDATQGWTQTTHQANPNARLGSAEVIAEAPSNGTVLPLSNFGTVTFANDMINGAALGNANVSALTMVSAAGVTEATPSALTGGTSFTVTWDNSGVAPAASPAASGLSRPR